MALALTRSIDERAYLSETALMFAINMAHVITHEVVVPQKNPKNVEKVIANAQLHYPSMEIETFTHDKTIPLMKRIQAWKKKLVVQGEIFMLEACGWQVIPLSFRDIPPFIHLHAPIE